MLRLPGLAPSAHDGRIPHKHVLPAVPGALGALHNRRCPRQLEVRPGRRPADDRTCPRRGAAQVLARRRGHRLLAQRPRLQEVLRLHRHARQLEHPPVEFNAVNQEHSNFRHQVLLYSGSRPLSQAKLWCSAALRFRGAKARLRNLTPPPVQGPAHRDVLSRMPVPLGIDARLLLSRRVAARLSPRKHGRAVPLRAVSSRCKSQHRCH